MEPKAFAGDLSICNVHLSALHSTLQFVLDVKLFTIFGRKQQLLMKSDTLGGIRVENYAAFFIKMCPPDVQVLFQRCNTLCNENCTHIKNRSCNCSSFLYHLIFHASMATSVVSCGEGKSMEKTAGIHHLWCLKE